jgi:hypothetical protein
METATEKKQKAETKICSLNDLLFPVELIDNPRNTNPEYCKVVTGVIGGQEMDLNYCSDRYALVPNANIFPQIENVLNAHRINFTPEYKHINNVRFYADYAIDDKRYGYKMKGSNDVIQPMLRVQHSYNGLTKYRIVFGYFRLVCSNGLVIAVEEMKEFNLAIVGKHTEQILHSFDELDTMLQNFGENAKEITNALTAKYEMLGGRWVENVQDRLTEVLKATKIAMVDTSKFNTLNDITNRIMTEAQNASLGYNGKVNDWLIYNGINQYMFSDRTIAAPETRMETDSKVFEYLLANA